MNDYGDRVLYWHQMWKAEHAARIKAEVRETEITERFGLLSEEFRLVLEELARVQEAMREVLSGQSE